MRKIPVALLLSLFLLSSIAAPCEDVVNPKLTGKKSLFRLLGWSDSFVFFLLNNYYYNISELNVFETATLGNGEVKPVKRVRIPVYPESVALVGSSLYITDSRMVYRYTMEMTAFEPVQALSSLVMGGRCALSREGLFAVARRNEITVFKISGEQIATLNTPLHVMPKDTTVLWAGENGIIVHDESANTLVVADINLGVVSTHRGIFFVLAEGDGFFDLGTVRGKEGEASRKEGLNKAPLVVCDGKFKQYKAKWYSRLKHKFNRQDDVIGLWEGSIAQFYRDRKLLFESYGPAEFRYPIRNCVTPRLWYKCTTFTDKHIFIWDIDNGRVYTRPLEQGGSLFLPASPMVSADLETREGTLAMLFADGTWAKVSVSDWKPKVVTCHEALSGEILSASPQGKFHAVSTDRRLFAIDEKGVLYRSNIYLQSDSNRMDHILFEQGGTRVALVEVSERITWSKGMKASMRATLYDLKDWYSNNRRPTEIGRTSRFNFRNQLTPVSWRVINFIGETGKLLAHINDTVEILPSSDAKNRSKPRCNSREICNLVWAGGMRVTPDKVFRLGDTQEIDLKIPGAGNWFVPTWRLPGTKCVLFLSIGEEAEKDRICAIHLKPRNEQERVLWLDAPKGTRWLARDGKTLLCISAFGRLLGRLEFPEWLLEKSESKDAGM